MTIASDLAPQAATGGRRKPNAAMTAVHDVIDDGKPRSREQVVREAIDRVIASDRQWAISQARVSPKSQPLDDDELARRGARWQVQKAIAVEISRRNIGVTSSGDTEQIRFLGQPRVHPAAEAAQPEPKRKHLIPPLVLFGHVHEADVLALAPPQERDQLFFRIDEEKSTATFDVRRLRDAMPFPSADCYVEYGIDDGVRIWVPPGHGEAAREFVAQWCRYEGIKPHNLRVAFKNSVWRDLRSVRQDWRDELISRAYDYLVNNNALRLRGKAQQALQKCGQPSDPDSVDQTIRLKVVEYITKYDDRKTSANGTPLTLCAFLREKSKNIDADISRAENGRGKTDRGSAVNKALIELLAEGFESPAPQLIADRSGLTVDQVIKTLQEQRDAANFNRPLMIGTQAVHDSESGPDGVQISSVSDNADLASVDYGMQAAVSRAMVKSALAPKGSGRGHKQVDTVAFTSMFLQVACEKKPTEIAAIMGVTPTAVHHGISRMQDGMREIMFGDDGLA